MLRSILVPLVDECALSGKNGEDNKDARRGDNPTEQHQSHPLVVALRKGDAALVSSMLDQTSDAWLGEGLDDVTVGDSTRTTPLIAAAKAGRTKVMHTILKGGSGRIDVNQVDQREQSALLAAATGGHHNCVALLCDAGADVDSGRVVLGACYACAATSRLRD